MANNARFASVEAMLRALKPGYPVVCLYPDILRRQAQRFLNGFPGRVLYAVKCNPYPAILKSLYRAGVRHFDTASLAEVALVREMFPDAEAYFNHPVKQRAAIEAAYKIYGVTDFVVDHVDELRKIIDIVGTEGINIQVRIATPSDFAAFNLSSKFGAEPDEAVALLKMVEREGMTPGLSFHVGSQCLSPAAYTTALERAGQVIERAGVQLQMLNVGGGFPAQYADVQAPSLEEYFAAIEAAIRKIPLRRDCVLMCEPGRAMVAEGERIVVQISLRKGNRLYINDGYYGTLSELKIAGGMRPPVRLIRLSGEPAADYADFQMFGPTCDSEDVLPHPFSLPSDAREGDWIEIAQMGAYSNAIGTHFNGFTTTTFVEISEGPAAAAPLG